jgi:hypothetical protein
MAKITLGKAAIRAIESAVGELFSNLKARFIGKHLFDKKINLDFSKEDTLSGLFSFVSREESKKPDEDLETKILRSAENFLDAEEEHVKAKVVANVDSFLDNAARNGTNTDWQTVLGGQLSDVWRTATDNVKRIIQTESNNASNVAVLSSAMDVAAAMGIPDPCVFWICVHDNKRCLECTRLHLMPDQVTPRVWRLSEVGGGYHKKGDPDPKISGLHPNERCVLVPILPGFGFKDGRISYIEKDHDELKAQRS